MTKKEIVARMLVKGMPNWFYSYELVQKATEGGFSGIAPMERAYDLVKEGFETPNARYTFQHRKKGRYAQFRCSDRAGSPKMAPKSDERAENIRFAAQLVKEFDNYTSV